MRIMNWKEFLVHPLFLLGVGSLITIFFVPRFTDRYNKKRRETEIKHDFIVKITELEHEWKSVIVDEVAPLKGKTDWVKQDRKIIELAGKMSVINSLLVFYFSNELLFSNWDRYWKSYPKYYDCVSTTNNKHSLDVLSKILDTDKIKLLKELDFRNSVEDRISNLFSEVLESIEDSDLIR